MLTYYCPTCWQVMKECQKICPNCGQDLDNIAESTFDDKLLSALYHTVPERKIMAAHILGVRQCKRALPEFKEILKSDEKDYFFLRAVLLAAATFEDPEREVVLKQSKKHPSNLISRLADELLIDILAGKKIDHWDRHSG